VAGRLSMSIRASLGNSNPVSQPPSIFGGDSAAPSTNFVYPATGASGGTSAGAVNSGRGVTFKIGEKGR